jgi:hypothetical protein
VEGGVIIILIWQEAKVKKLTNNTQLTLDYTGMEGEPRIQTQIPPNPKCGFFTPP